MNVRLDKVLRRGLQFYHEYDFGTTTELKLKVVDVISGPVQKGVPLIMARNEPPVYFCQTCEEPATQLCVECVYEDAGLLCEECAGEHDCDENYLLPLVNSPRVGQCGYAG